MVNPAVLTWHTPPPETGGGGDMFVFQLRDYGSRSNSPASDQFSWVARTGTNQTSIWVSRDSAGGQTVDGQGIFVLLAALQAAQPLQGTMTADGLPTLTLTNVTVTISSLNIIEFNTVTAQPNPAQPIYTFTLNPA